MTFFTLLVWCLCAFACYKIAEDNNRDKGLAAILGFVFGIFAVAGYLLAGEKK